MDSKRQLHLLSATAPAKMPRLAFLRLTVVGLLALVMIGLSLGATPVMAQDISTPQDEPQQSPVPNQDKPLISPILPNLSLLSPTGTDGTEAAVCGNASWVNPTDNPVANSSILVYLQLDSCVFSVLQI